MKAALKHDWLSAAPTHERHKSIMSDRHRRFRMRRKWQIAALAVQATSRFVEAAKPCGVGDTTDGFTDVHEQCEPSKDTMDTRLNA